MQNTVDLLETGMLSGANASDLGHLTGSSSLFQARRIPPAQGAPPERSCSHWPLDGEARIQAASNAFVMLADLLAWARVPVATAGDTASRSMDLELVANIEEVDALFEFTDTAPARIDELRRAVRDLAHEYETASAWLTDAVALGWSSVKGMRPAPRCASILDEGHRVIAKDWLTADMTLLIGWLLRRAIKSLDQMDLSPAAVRSDLGSQRSYEAMLRSVAEMLDRACALAAESVSFLGEIDQRLQLFRQQVTSVISLAQDGDLAHQAAPRRHGRGP